MPDGTDLSVMRNIGMMAHIDAGKTTTTERILYYTGKIHKIGEVDKGTATMDWMRQEQERGITITSAASACVWKNHVINIIDTPGHVDFTVEVERSLRVLDGAVGIFCAVAGVQPQSETVWRQADRYQIPRIAYINKMDRVGANYFAAVNTLSEQLGCNTLIVQLPLGSEEQFQGIIDVVKLKAYVYQDDAGENFLERELTAEEFISTTGYRNALLEKISEYDDEMLEKYLEGKEISPEEIILLIRKMTISNGAVPVLCGSSFKNKGVQMLLDAIIDYLPSPKDKPAVTGIDPDSGTRLQRMAGLAEPLTVLAFKVTVDPFVGKLTYLRIYSGVLKSGSYVLNSKKRQKERITKILRMHANSREELDTAFAGDIVAGVGLKNTVTGDTICSELEPILLETIDFPDPVVDIAVEPKTKADQDRMGESLRRLAEEDPTFIARVDESSGQTILSGMGELHLEIIVDRLLKEFKVNANIGKPQVAYKETIKTPAQSEIIFDKQTGGHGQFAHIILEAEPLPEGSGKLFEYAAATECMPREFASAVEVGVMEALQAGILAGYPVDDIKVRLTGGSYHEADSTELAFKIAGVQGLKGILDKAEKILLEPIMYMEIICPDEYVGDVIADLNARRGKVSGFEENRDSKIIKGAVPLAETFGYVTALRSLSQGRASFSLHMSNYAEVPENKNRDIISKRYGI
ncbi:MAG: elongation factor G [Syntrophomonadaceae bacterium]|jgi:elongation factor G|nr:elongation factor G [Syntrophomonadaceae bacterium]